MRHLAAVPVPGDASSAFDIVWARGFRSTLALGGALALGCAPALAPTAPPPTVEFAAPPLAPASPTASLPLTSASATAGALTAPAPDPLRPLTPHPELHRLSLTYLAARHRAEPEARLAVLGATYLDDLDVGVVEYRFTARDGSERRLYGLIGRVPGGHQTLDLGQPYCGQLEEGIWDLRGDGQRAIVFTEVGGGHHCHLAGATVAYELSEGRWVEVTPVPHGAPFATDANGDAIPDYFSVLHTFDFGDCVYAACGDYFWRVDIPGYESWDGHAYVSKGRYAAYYRKRFAELEQSSRALQPAQNLECERERVEDGASAFAYGILSGQPRARALAVARRYLAGVDPLTTCVELGPVRSRAEIEQALLAAEPTFIAAR